MKTKTSILSYVLLTVAIILFFTSCKKDDNDDSVTPNSLTTGSFTDNRDGNTYKTVKIGTQWWMAENLRIGMRIDADQEMTDNGIIEKYCIEDDDDNCEIYGGFYVWDEVMQYTSQEGGQGLCPEGWHVPSDNEWKILEGTVDSQFPKNDLEWDNISWRGYDVGRNLKSTSGWTNDGNGIDSFGFNAIGSDLRYTGGYFGGSPGYSAYFWTSSEGDGGSAWYRMLEYGYKEIDRCATMKEFGRNVRCIKN